MSNKILHLNQEDIVLAVQLPEDRAVVVYGVRQVEVPLDAPFGVGDTFSEATAVKKAAKPKIVTVEPQE